MNHIDNQLSNPLFDEEWRGKSNIHKNAFLWQDDRLCNGDIITCTLDCNQWILLYQNNNHYYRKNQICKIKLVDNCIYYMAILSRRNHVKYKLLTLRDYHMNC